MSEDINKVLDSISAEFKTQQEETGKLIEKYGKDSVDAKARLEKVEVELGKKLDEVKKQSDAIQTALNRQGSMQKDCEISIERKDMLAYFKDGIEGKTLSTGDDSNGGYLINPEMGSMFDETITELSPMRQIAEVISMNKGTEYLRVVNKKGGVGAVKDSEMNLTAGGKTPTLGIDRIAVHGINALCHVTTDYLDEPLDTESRLAIEASEDFATTENNAFFNGTGVGEASGFLKANAGLSQVASGSATTFTTDGILKLMGSIKGAYRSNAKFLANRTSIFQHLFTLKDGEDRNFLVPDFRNGFQFMLVGTPLLEATDMPETEANALALAYGDFKKGYTIVDRKGVTVDRDTSRAKPLVEFWFRKRYGGKVKIKEAIALQKIAVS